MQSERHSKILLSLILITIVFLLLLVSAIKEEVYEPEIQIIDIGSIDKSTSGITDVWPFETITITLNPEKFNAASANVTIRLSLPDNDVELHLTEHEMPADQQKIKLVNESGIFILGETEFHTYTGYVDGYENSSLLLRIHRNLLFGTIDLEGNPYHIDLTKKSMNGKPILAIYRQDDIIVSENTEPEL